MAEKYYSILTNRGKALETESAATGTLVVLTHFVVGDGNGQTAMPDPTLTALVHEVYRAGISSLAVSQDQPNQMMAHLVLPANKGGYVVREVGLLTDGGELYAVANCAAIEKPEGGVSVNIQFRLAVSDTAEIELKVATGDGLFLRIDRLLGEIAAQGEAAQLTAQQSLDIYDASTLRRGLVQLTSATDSAEENRAATPRAIKVAMDNANARLEKAQNGTDIPDKNQFVFNIGAAVAFSGGINIGGDNNPWTTADFITWLDQQGAFGHPYWMCKGSWSYAENKVITDTGCGLICLAGAVVEVMGNRGAMTIRVTTPTTTSGGGVPSAQFIYINHGPDYAPGWRRDFNTVNHPTSVDVGAVAKTGDTMTGQLKINTRDALRIYDAEFGMIFRRSEDYLHIIPTAVNEGENGEIGPLRPFAINLRTGLVVMSHGAHVDGALTVTGSVQAGAAKIITMGSADNSALNAGFRLWGGEGRPTVIELDDDSGWHLYSQRNPDGSISFAVNGAITPANYSNFDSRYVLRDAVSYAGFAANNESLPYMRNATTGNIIYLARQDWVNGNFISAMRFGAPSDYKERGLNERLAGGVMTSFADRGSSNYWIRLRPLQYLINGSWQTAAYA